MSDQTTDERIVDELERIADQLETQNAALIELIRTIELGHMTEHERMEGEERFPSQIVNAVRDHEVDLEHSDDENTL